MVSNMPTLRCGLVIKGERSRPNIVADHRAVLKHWPEDVKVRRRRLLLLLLLLLRVCS